LSQVVHKRLEQVDIFSFVNTNTHHKILSLPGVPPEAMPAAAAAHQKKNPYEFIIKPKLGCAVIRKWQSSPKML
jgi:hypothetical protein